MRNEGTCFGSDDNKIRIISEDDDTEYDKKPKKEVAKDIINRLAEII